MRTIAHWVDGQYYEGNPTGRFAVENPGTGEVEAELLQASDADLDHTVEVARRAQKEWAKVSLAKRTAIMFRMRQLVLDHQDEDGQDDRGRARQELLRRRRRDPARA